MQENLATDVQINSYSIIAFIAYLVLISLIGAFSARFSSTGISEFFIGGRRMNRFVVALSAVVSGRSSWLLLGVTGMAYKMGAPAVWAVLGYIVVELFLFLFYARRLRRFSEVYDCVTLPDFFASRFGDNNGYLRLTLAIIIIIFMISYVSAQFVGGGKAFAAGFGLEPTTGIILTAAIVLFYTVLGGFMAVSITDMIQAFFMIFALLLLPLIAIFDRGGFAVIIVELTNFNPEFINPFALSLGAAIGFLGIGLGSPGNPHIISRYMSIDDPEQLKYSAVVGTIWNVLMAVGAIMIGLIGRVYFPEVSLLPGSDTENLYPVLAQQQLHPVLFGIVTASIFAAIMSTADSQLLVAASGIVRDIYEKLVRKNETIEQKRLVLLSRIVVIILVIVALVLGMLMQQLIFWLVLFAWAGLGASLGPTSILSLYWKNVTRNGIFAGLFTGAIVTFLWYNIPILKAAMYELIPAFIISFAVIIIVSKFSSKPTDIERAFETMQSNTFKG